MFLCSAVLLRTRVRSFFCSGTCSVLRAFFFARRRARRSGSTALAALRSALDKCASCAPKSGLPFGNTAVGVGFVDGRALLEGAIVEGVAAARGLLGVLSEPGKVLQRSTRNLRFANLSLPGSRASISSTHSRSCLGETIRSFLCKREVEDYSPQIGHRQILCPAACPCRGQFAHVSPTSSV